MLSVVFPIAQVTIPLVSQLQKKVCSDSLLGRKIACFVGRLLHVTIAIQKQEKYVQSKPCLYEIHCWSIMQNKEIIGHLKYKVDFKAV